MREPLNSRGNTEGGMHQSGGPRDFQAVTAGGHKWVVYSNGQSQVGATRIPLAALLETRR